MSSKKTVFNGQDEYYGEGYAFSAGKDDFIRVGTVGYDVTFGEMVYRAANAVDRLRHEGIEVGLIRKSTLNVVDEEVLRKYGSSPFVSVVEPFNQRTGLGSKMGNLVVGKTTHSKIQVSGNDQGGLWRVE